MKLNTFSVLLINRVHNFKMDATALAQTGTANETHSQVHLYPVCIRETATENASDISDIPPSIVWLRWSMVRGSPLVTNVSTISIAVTRTFKVNSVRPWKNWSNNNNNTQKAALAKLPLTTHPHERAEPHTLQTQFTPACTTWPSPLPCETPDLPDLPTLPPTPATGPRSPAED